MVLNVDLKTLVLILGFIHLVQVLVFYHHYRINKAVRGPGWWLMWSTAEAIGFGAILLRGNPAFLPFVIILQNAMIITGTVFLYISVARFFGKPVRYVLFVPVLAIFLLALHYFLFIDPNLQVRSVFINATLAYFGLLTTYCLLRYKTPDVNATANFLSLVFGVHSLIFIARSVLIMTGTPVDNFFSPTVFNLLPFFDALIVSLLWTIGFIILLNQRLNSEMAKTSEDLELIFNTSPDASIITRLDDGLIMNVNDGYTRITGYTRQEILGKSTLGINMWKNPEDRHNVIACLKENGYCENYEAVFVKKDGTEIVGLMSARLIRLKEIPCVVSITRDITQSKKAEKERQLFHNLLEQSLNEIYIFEMPALRFIAVNRGARQNLGYSMSELQKMTPLDLKPEISESRFHDLIMPLVENRVPMVQFSTVHRRKDSSVYPVDVYLSFIPKEKTFVAVILDVTEARRKEEELRVSATRFKNVFEHATVGKTLTYPDGTLVANEAFCTITGYTPEELAGIRWQELTHPEDIARDLEIRNRILKGEKDSDRWVKRYIHKNGTDVFVDISTVIQRDETGKPEYFITTVSDITALRDATEEIRKLNADLEIRVAERTAQLVAANHELEAFTYTVSHDLRAPLRAIDGFTRILVDEYDTLLDDEGRRICSVICANSLKMGRLIDDLLSFSHLNRHEIIKTVIDFHSLCLEVYLELTNEESRKKIHLDLKDIGDIFGDPALIRQVLINLLSNAIKFSSHRQQIRITIGSRSVNGMRTCWVSDNGAGFDMKYSGKLFGVFQRLHKIDEFEGTGVGLAIVQRIIRRHGGEVWAEGELDKGSTFFFSLPMD